MAGKQPKRKPREGLDEYGRTPLHYAAAEAQLVEIIKLIAAGADVNAQDDNGWSPLHFSAQAVSPDCTAALLRAGADVSLQDLFGNTALWRAVFSSEADSSVIHLLLEAGANPIEKNKHGISPISLARTIANFDVAKYFSDVSHSDNES